MKTVANVSQYFREVQPKFTRLCASHLGRMDLTMPQYSLLSILNVEGEVAMTALSGRLHITKPAITNLVDRLEKHGFIRRKADPQDRRVTLIAIEKAGKRCVAQMQTRIIKILLQTLSRFSAEEKQVVTRFYAALSKTLDLSLNKMPDWSAL